MCNIKLVYIMKKIITVALSIVFVSAMMVSCKTSHTRCAAYGKINKIDTGKAFTDKSAKDI